MLMLKIRNSRGQTMTLIILILSSLLALGGVSIDTARAFDSQAKLNGVASQASMTALACLMKGDSFTTAASTAKTAAAASMDALGFDPTSAYRVISVSAAKDSDDFVTIKSSVKDKPATLLLKIIPGLDRIQLQSREYKIVRQPINVTIAIRHSGFVTYSQVGGQILERLMPNIDRFATINYGSIASVTTSMGYVPVFGGTGLGSKGSHKFISTAPTLGNQLNLQDSIIMAVNELKNAPNFSKAKNYVVLFESGTPTAWTMGATDPILTAPTSAQWPYPTSPYTNAWAPLAMPCGGPWANTYPVTMVQGGQPMDWSTAVWDTSPFGPGRFYAACADDSDAPTYMKPVPDNYCLNSFKYNSTDGTAQNIYNHLGVVAGVGIPYADIHRTDNLAVWIEAMRSAINEADIAKRDSKGTFIIWGKKDDTHILKVVSLSYGPIISQYYPFYEKMDYMLRLIAGVPDSADPAPPIAKRDPVGLYLNDEYNSTDYYAYTWRVPDKIARFMEKTILTTN